AAAEPASPDGRRARAVTPLPGPVTGRRDPQALFAGESLGQALRQLVVYGRDGLPVLSEDGRQVLGWVTNNRVLHTVAQKINTAQEQTAQAQLAAEWALPDPESALREPPTPLRGYQILEVTIEAGSPAAGRALRTITWPPGATMVSVLHNRRIRDPDPALTLSPGDRIILLTPKPHDQPPGPAPGTGAAGRTAESPAPAHRQGDADGP
ncbi:MAG: TrkA C-terminal domain-containing protein, partial [Streptosporangiaceae bacterium]